MTAPVDKKIEAKVWASTLATLLFAGLAGLHTAVQDNPDLLFGLPPWLQFVLITVLPTLATFGAGYQRRSNRVEP